MDELELIRIKQWTFDPLNRTLTLESPSNSADAQQVVETLEAKHALLLHTLAANQGQTLTREQLVSLVWQDRYVDDRTINATISRLRKVLGGQKDEFIKTHPKVGYSFVPDVFFFERQDTSKQYLVTASQFKYKQYFLYTCFLLSLIIALVAFHQLYTSGGSKSQPLPSGEIFPLTYLKGINYSPSLSKGQDLLAFVNQKTLGSKRHVIVQSLETNQTLTIDEHAETGSPLWASKNDNLYYQAYEDGICWIRHTSISPDLTLGPGVDITQCGELPFFQGLSIAQGSPWVYYSFGTANSTPYYRIRKVHLHTGKSEDVTTPPVKYNGDFMPRIRKDAKYLAFLRDFDDGSTAIMLKNNETGEVKHLIQVSSSLSSFEWSSQLNSLLYTDENNVLSAINIYTKKTTPLFASSDRINDPVQIEDSQVIASIGEQFLNSIMLKPLTGTDRELRTAISSAFRDYGATVFSNGKANKIAFVSDRSGSNQIWVLDKNIREKLSAFEGMESPKDLRFSPDGEKLLYMYKQQPYILNITTKEHTKLPIENQQVKNPIWLCKSSDEVMFIALSVETWSLQKINVKNFQVTTIASDISAINSDCSTNKYYVSKVDLPGLYEINMDENIVYPTPILTKYDFVRWDYWATYNNHVYVLDTFDKLLAYDVNSLSTTEVDIGNLSTRRIKIENGKLIIESFDINNTFIGRITTL